MSEIICHCFEVSREELENALRETGLKTVEEVGEATNQSRNSRMRSALTIASIFSGGKGDKPIFMRLLE